VTATSRQAHVLIVDDNPGDSELITIGFETLGWSVRTTLACDGQVALETITALAAKGDCPDLILLDLNMPRVNGFEVLRFLAAEHCCQATTVVVMTTSNAPRDQERSLELGAKACITKPPGFDDLLKVLSSFEPYLQPQLG
jgi:chemotaxis family two-component system response regulator Rcp1